MVTIIGWQKRQKENGDSFNVLNLQGGIEMIKSSKTDKFYATARKANLVCTFDDATCATMVGQKLPGTIEKVECEPYEYTIPNSKETIILGHSFVYSPKAETVEEHVIGAAA